MKCCKVFHRNTPSDGPCHNKKEDYIRFVQTTGARGAEAEKVPNDFKLKVPSLIRGTEYVRQKRSEDLDVKTVKRQFIEDHDPTRRVAMRPTPVENQDNWKRAKKSSLSLSSSSSSAAFVSSSFSDDSFISLKGKEPCVEIQEPEKVKDQPK
ncbi:hypothetical protein DPMN_071710 [Dreissena polymorpha]|uniref:Uncharacterized protein n=1 Tax=Dreissena polymorpha TaxID=45954 RepID=A0A9D3Z3F5_DREPO|nr:hypothetical protein DPMN_071710 [Dreissena polymorpha]